jgi:hypothetical protein
MPVLDRFDRVVAERGEEAVEVRRCDRDQDGPSIALRKYELVVGGAFDVGEAEASAPAGKPIAELVALAAFELGNRLLYCAQTFQGAKRSVPDAGIAAAGGEAAGPRQFMG